MSSIFCVNLSDMWSSRLCILLLPKSSGNLNATRKPVMVWPAAVRRGEQYPLLISVPTTVKVRGRVLEFHAFS
jgi:hypothetical protein